jgi:surfeit locus 1 family protein
VSRSHRWPLVLLFVGIALLCARLGLWQVERLRDREAANAAVAEARLSPAVDLTTAERVTDVRPGQAVAARGSYDFEHEIVVMGRVLGGTPGVHVLTPLRLEGGERAVLVNRGFVPAPDAFSVDLDSLREPGRVEVSGVVQPFAPTGDRSPPSRRSGAIAVGRVHYGSLRDLLPYRLLPVIVRQDTAAGLPVLPQRLPPDPLDEGPHLGYAIQWFAFAVIALAFAVVFSRRINSPRSAP